MRTIGNAGLSLIKKFEGCRLTAYQDAVGVWTIGYGHTSSVKRGQTITQAQADEYLRADCQRFADFVDNKAYVPITASLNDNQRDALISFAFNLGQGNLRKVCYGRNAVQIATAMPLYCNAGGKKLQGLVNRRNAEVALFNTPCCNSQNSHVASQSGHIQLNYKVGQKYTVCASSLRIRTKKASHGIGVIPSGTQIGSKANGSSVNCRATAAVGKAIWMYLGNDTKGREQWICADNGTECYVR